MYTGTVAITQSCPLHEENPLGYPVGVVCNFFLLMILRSHASSNANDVKTVKTLANHNIYIQYSIRIQEGILFKYMLYVFANLSSSIMPL